MSEFLIIAETVLRRENRAMSAREIIDVAEREQLLPDDFTGKTPHQTLKSKLSVSIRTGGESCRFVRTAPGRFALRDQIARSDVYEAPPHRPPPSSEDVLGFPASRLDAVGRFDGILKSHKRVLAALLSDGVDAQARTTAEQDDGFKQLITYVLVRRGDSVLAYRRGRFNRVEHFLRGADCIGFGGHVTFADLNLFTQNDAGISAAAIRELSEELVLPNDDLSRLASGRGLQILGLLNDDSSPAGRRHLAVVFRYDVSDDPAWDAPTRGEKSITRLRWLRPGDDVRLHEFEYWSQLCLRTFHRRIAQRRPEIRAHRLRPFTPPHIMCIVGQIGSGKSEAADTLQEDRGYVAVNSGEVVASLIGLPPVTEATREQFQAAAMSFVDTADGPQRLGQALAQHAAASGAARVVIDGIRQRATLEELRRVASTRVAVLYVHTSADVALDLYRQRSGTEASMLDLARLRESPVEREVPGFLGIADAVLFNWEGRTRYRELVRDFIDSPRLRIL